VKNIEKYRGCEDREIDRGEAVRERERRGTEAATEGIKTPHLSLF
jgi:hypothetical protein